MVVFMCSSIRGLGSICRHQPKEGIGPSECKIHMTAATAASTATTIPISTHFRIFCPFDGWDLGACASTMY